MYTQCPKCLTYFQVTAEHLKVAQGNVRCGQCSNVFSALGNLSEIAPQQNSTQSSQTNKRSNAGIARSAERHSAGPTTASTASNPQSKLTSAIAAIQALNQSSQKILSQGRKNYVTQLQKQAQVKKKITPSSTGGSTARKLNQETDEDAMQTAHEDAGKYDAINIDIEEALAAVEGIGVDQDDLPIQYGDDSDDEDITPAFDGSDLVEDYRNRDSNSAKNSPAGKKRAKIIKSDTIDDDIFNFSEFDLPEEEISARANQNKGKNAGAKKQNAVDKKTANKKAVAKKSAKTQADNSRSHKPVSERPPRGKQREEPGYAESEIVEEIVIVSSAANDQVASKPQHVVSDPEVIIENNIPTLAIPKALLEDFEKEKISHVNYRSMVTWGGLSVLMMLTFLGQAIYFKHNELGQISQLRPWIQMFCKRASCELTMQVDIGQIELLGQDIRSHPKSDKALLVSATIINNASFTQPYPGLQLSFSDINGVKVATRNFFPKDYLPSKFSTKKGMESNIPIQLELELADPGKSAVNFEFDFFSI